MTSEFLNPEKTLNEIEIQQDMIAADFGCGSGGWVLPLAKILEDGKIYAVDVLEEPLSALRSKADSQGFSNIETILSDIENSSKISDESCDLILITNLLFGVEDKEAVLKEAKKVLKSEGEILVVDWKKQAGGFGPQKQERISADQVKKIAEQLDLKLKKEFDAGGYHYALLFQKS